MTEASWTMVRAAIAEAPAGVEVGVSVRNLTTGATFGHEADLVLPAASTVKLLVLVALARAVDGGRVRLNDTATVLISQKVGGSGVLNWLQDGLELSLQDHAWLMIAISDNTASNLLIDTVGLPAIHEVQRSLELASTSLNRRFLGRVPAPGAPENLATAGELTTILAAIAAGTAANPQRCEWMLALLGDQQVTDRLARHLPDGVRFAGKSGWLTGLSHDVGLLRGPRGEAAVAVMTRGFADRYAAAAFIGTIGAAVVEDLNLA